MKNQSRRAFRLSELTALYIVMPLVLCVFTSRLVLYLAVWGAGLYSFFILRRHVPFQILWQGHGWSHQRQRYALWRFILLALFLAFVVFIVWPDRWMRFPRDHFSQWCLVMFLYPWLSVLPQEIFFRSFSFMRYRELISSKRLYLLMNGLLFGFSHIVLDNAVAPTLCAIGGIIFATSYDEHHSLKWSLIEHTFYGCWIFTIGLGKYFYVGNWHS